MANITLLGASYTDVPAVDLPQTGGGTVRFYENGGGGSGYTRTVIVSQQTVTPTYRSDGGVNGYVVDLSNAITEPLAELSEYIVTFNGTEYFSTATLMWGSNVLIGDVNWFWGGSDLPYPFGILYYNGECTLAVGSGDALTIKVEKLELTGGGGDATLITKTITANGTYSAEDDDADGYSEVTVNVAGGASNIVTGTFKGTTTGAAMDVDLAYTGNGYPVAIIIYPKEGAYNSNSAAYTLVQRYASLWFNAVKSYADVAPNYDNSGTDDQYTITNRTKNSSSNSTGYSTNIGPDIIVASGGDAAQTVQNVVKLKSKTKMSVYIASSSYGFPANIEFTYRVIYSS